MEVDGHFAPGTNLFETEGLSPGPIFSSCPCEMPWLRTRASRLAAKRRQGRRKKGPLHERIIAKVSSHNISVYPIRLRVMWSRHSALTDLRYLFLSLLVPQQPIVPDQLPFLLSTSHLAMGLVHLTRSGKSLLLSRFNSQLTPGFAPAAPSLLRLAAAPPSPHNLHRRLPPILPGPFPFYDPRSPGPSTFFRPHPRVHAAASGTNQQSLSEPRNGMEYVLGTLRSRTGRGREVSGLW